MAFLHSQAVLIICGFLAAYFAAKIIAVLFQLWIPQHRKETLSDAQLRTWRATTALEALGLGLVFFGLWLGAATLMNAAYAASLVGVVVFVIFKAINMKKFPYIDPKTVKKSKKKKK